jgi:hypothetical protein
MGLSTLKFGDLRESVNEKLAKVGHQAGIAAEGENERAQIGKLLDDRAHIEDLASTQPQREAYGVEKFHGNFVMLRSITSDPCSRYEGEELRHFIWNSVPHCPFKRFQELFCHEHQFVVPRFTIAERNRVMFADGGHFNRLSLEACMVSPDRISDDFACSTGLCAFEDGDTPLERLEKKRSIIPSLKLMFASAVPLQHGHQRMLEVERASQEMEKQYGASVPKKALGTILYSRENGNGRAQHGKSGIEPPRQLVVSHFESAYAALRKTAHERASYDAEQLELVKLRQEIASLNARCNRDWHDKISCATKDAILRDAHALLNRGHTLLEHCVNAHKVSASVRIDRCGNLLTKSNVSAAMASMVGALNSLSHRLKEMTPKEGHNEQDRLTLMERITAEELSLKEIRRGIIAAAQTLDQNPTIRDVGSLGIDAYALGQIALQPLRTYSDKMMEKCAALDRALFEQRPDVAKTAMVQAHIIGKFQAARTCFEHIKLWIAEGRCPPAGNVREFVSKLNVIFADRSVWPEITVEGYEGVFVTMQERLQGIERQLGHYAQRPMDADAQTAMQQRLRGYLDTFDLETIVRELP